jgi:hypothetical protein
VGRDSSTALVAKTGDRHCEVFGEAVAALFG